MGYVEALHKSQSELQESYGDVIDVSDYLTDTPGFGSSSGIGYVTQIFDRADGRQRPTYQNEIDLKRIRAMAWLLSDRVPMANAWANRLADYTIAAGFDWTIKHTDPNIQAQCKAIVVECFDNSAWPSEMERESFIREIEDGEWIGQIAWDQGPCIFSREADEMTEPARKAELEEYFEIYDYVPSWSFGVLTEQYRTERPFGYHLVRDQGAVNWDFLWADSVCHWKRNVRRRAKRGVSDFFVPHMYLMRADRVLKNTLDGAALQAAIAYIVEHAEGTSKTSADSMVKASANNSSRFTSPSGLSPIRKPSEGAKRLDVPNGQKYTAGMVGSNQSDIYIEVMEAALRLAGTICAFPEGMITGSYQNNILASSMTAESPFIQGRHADQLNRSEKLKQLIIKVLYVAHKHDVVGRGRTWQEFRAGLTVECQKPNIVSRDIAASTTSTIALYEKGLVSQKTAIMDTGHDPDVEAANGLKLITPLANSSPVDGTEQPIDVSTDPASEPQKGAWQNSKRIDWHRNRKASQDILSELAAGSLDPELAKVYLSQLGISSDDIERMVAAASKGNVQESITTGTEIALPQSDDPKLSARQEAILESWAGYP